MSEGQPLRVRGSFINRKEAGETLGAPIKGQPQEPQSLGRQINKLAALDPTAAQRSGRSRQRPLTFESQETARQMSHGLESLIINEKYIFLQSSLSETPT